MGRWVLLAVAAVVLVTVVAALLGRGREAAAAERLTRELLASASPMVSGTVDFASLGELPAPVERYFRLVLTDGQELVHSARMGQSGVLRTSTDAATWSSFTATEFVVPPGPGFLWDARVAMPAATHVRVLDSYIAGAGAGRVSLLSAFTMASDRDAPELNSGALYRYLAEAVWYPTALLPQSGVVWRPVDDRTAMAELTDWGTTVALEFRFNDAGEVAAIYSPGRFGAFDGGYREVPWEGHFWDYRSHAGMRIPAYGEVGWYEDGVLQLVWKGDLTDVRYEFGGHEDHG